MLLKGNDNNERNARNNAKGNVSKDSSSNNSSSNKNSSATADKNTNADNRLGVANLSNYVSGDSSKSSSSHRFDKDSME